MHGRGIKLIIIIIKVTCVYHIIGPLSGPLNVILVEASPRHLTFSWTPISNLCRVQSYIINSSNCGVCPNITNLTTVRCTGFEVSSDCTFTVRTVVCDNIVGTVGTEISFTLHGKKLCQSTQHVNLGISKHYKIINFMHFYSTTTSKNHQHHAILF